ncbi:FAD-binding protein [Candidatus Poriferisodalis sp.]|uniref:FAD-binding protein n=1 Tax=Candidatus Poriferisodalis sp. TaxID=3101277 RepID=UPI003B02966C
MSIERWSDPDAVRRAAAVLGDGARVNAPLGALTTSRVGGPAAVGFVANDHADVQRAGEAAAVSGLQTLIVGRGSNLLVADRGFEGIALFLGAAYGKVEFDCLTGTVSAGASVPLPVLARQCAAAGIGGLEWAVGIPGSVGGAVRMNAGGHGSDLAACLIDADVVDLACGTPPTEQRITAADGELGRAPVGEPVPVDARSLDLGYRSSGLKPDQLVVRARLHGRRVPVSAAMARISDIVRWRREHQPGGHNCGSVFLNPPEESAGARIDRTGLRGLRVGTAEVSRLHANFIVSDPDGAAADVVSLIAEIRRRVTETSGVVLQPEVQMVGFDTPPASS